MLHLYDLYCTTTLKKKTSGHTLFKFGTYILLVTSHFHMTNYLPIYTGMYMYMK